MPHKKKRPDAEIVAGKQIDSVSDSCHYYIMLSPQEIDRDIIHCFLERDRQEDFAIYGVPEGRGVFALAGVLHMRYMLLCSAALYGICCTAG